MKTGKIIPVSYCTPTGGAFIAAFLTAAKNNNFAQPEFMKYGNSHRTGLDDVVVPRGEMLDTDEHKLNLLLDAPIEDNVPYFISTHLEELSILESNFDKVIRITYDSTDIDELINVYIGKVCFDVFDRDLTLSKRRGVMHMLYMLNHKESFVTGTTTDSVLYLPWKTIYHDDSSKLIKKLSKFTSIPVSQFNVQFLDSWKNKTQECISTVETLIN